MNEYLDFKSKLEYSKLHNPKMIAYYSQMVKIALDKIIRNY